MARQWPAIWEDHGPGHVGRPTPQFAIDEIGDAAEKQTDRPYRATQIAERQSRNVSAPCKQNDSDRAAGDAAVERHAAVPDLKDLHRMFGEMRQVIEQHIADAAPQDDAERDPDDEI